MSKSIKSESDSESSNYSVYGGSSDESDNSVYGGEYDFTAYGGNEYDGNEYINYSDVKDIEEKEEKEEKEDKEDKTYKGAYYSSLIDYGKSDEDTYGKNNTGGVEEIIGSALIENTEEESTDVGNTIGGDIQRALSSFLDSAESI